MQILADAHTIQYYGFKEVIQLKGITGKSIMY